MAGVPPEFSRHFRYQSTKALELGSVSSHQGILDIHSCQGSSDFAEGTWTLLSAKSSKKTYPSFVRPPQLPFCMSLFSQSLTQQVLNEHLLSAGHLNVRRAQQKTRQAAYLPSQTCQSQTKIDYKQEDGGRGAASGYNLQ